jgi:translation initiation factor IF-2
MKVCGRVCRHHGAYNVRVYSPAVYQTPTVFERVALFTMKKTSATTIQKRPPVVVIMGHIDHGKSTLLDYIRKSNVVAEEAGGITQHLSAYAVEHTTKEGSKETITFLDTPGHAAFAKMRLRGADVADIAVLIVSAEDGVKPQTLEALSSIKTAGIPFIVAINKIDKPAADVARTQSSLIENEIYIEGMGGDIPYALISAKSGQGVSELLDLIILAAELAELHGNPHEQATGTILEGHLDKKRGTTASMIVKNGTLKAGQYVVSGEAYAPVRIMEDAYGKAIKEAGLSMPIGIVGFSGVPKVGAPFVTVDSKKEAEALVLKNKLTPQQATAPLREDLPFIPLLIKADVLGSIDAIVHELEGYKSDRVEVKVVNASIGDITQNDVQNISATKNALIVGFNVKVEKNAQELAERLAVDIKTFSIIYELSLWLKEALLARTPKQEAEVVTGKAKILKEFSVQKNLHVLGARVEEGEIKLKQQVRIMRRDIEIGKGVIVNLQQAKINVSSLKEGEFGLQLNTKAEPAPGDYIEGIEIVVS